MSCLDTPHVRRWQVGLFVVQQTDSHLKIGYPRWAVIGHLLMYFAIALMILTVVVWVETIGNWYWQTMLVAVPVAAGTIAFVLYVTRTSWPALRGRMFLSVRRNGHVFRWGRRVGRASDVVSVELQRRNFNFGIIRHIRLLFENSDPVLVAKTRSADVAHQLVVAIAEFLAVPASYAYRGNSDAIDGGAPDPLSRGADDVSLGD